MLSNDLIRDCRKLPILWPRQWNHWLLFAIFCPSSSSCPPTCHHRDKWFTEGGFRWSKWYTHHFSSGYYQLLRKWSHIYLLIICRSHFISFIANHLATKRFTRWRLPIFYVRPSISYRWCCCWRWWCYLGTIKINRLESQCVSIYAKTATLCDTVVYITVCRNFPRTFKSPKKWVRFRIIYLYRGWSSWGCPHAPVKCL